MGTRCVSCATVTDLDLKSLQLDYLKQSDAKPPEEPMGLSVVIVVVKTGQKYTLRTAKVKIGRDPSNQVVIPDDTSPVGIMPGSLLKKAISGLKILVLPMVLCSTDILWSKDRYFLPAIK